jgi:hypothetical protein
LRDIFEYKLKEDIEHEIKTNQGFGEIILSRNYDLDMLEIQNDKLICIPRNPISITISGFYSFGYTHVPPPGLSAEEWLKRKLSIQNMGLENYIQKSLTASCKKIADIFDFECTNKIILPYELMISNFNVFLKDFLIAIDMQDCYSKTLERWKSSFEPIKDQSERIISNNYRGHKRTTDIYEWKSKLDENFQKKLCDAYPFILDYDHFLQTKFNL